jgi:Tol biopolymer transport system component
VGCHSVSHDGKKVAATFWGGDGTGGIIDGSNGMNFVLQPEPPSPPPRIRWNFSSFSPDGTLLLTNWKGVLEIRDGSTGQRMMNVPPDMLGGLAVMPEWSPDGQSIVFVQVPPEGELGYQLSPSQLLAGDWIVGNAGSIAVLPYNGGAFGQAKVLVPSKAMQEYNVYPSWSPDSQFIVFATVTYPGSSITAPQNLCPASCQAAGGSAPTGYVYSYDQDTARLRLVSATGGAPIELQNATHAMGRTATWPKFSPFLQTSSTGSTLVFFTFSAKFDYGFVVQGGFTPQLWMAGIDLAKAKVENPSDPSYPPFWLPFQDPKQNNHSGIWTTDVACSGMGTGDCPPEFTCENGVCVKVNIM